jgi:mono/diheme cytochrome c family protein
LLLGTVAIGQQKQTGGQEGIQQERYQNMTPAERAAATRAFLGLGAVPDKAAAKRGAALFKQNCGFCHGQNARGATGPSLLTSDGVLSDDHGEHLTPFLKKGRPDKGMPGFNTMTDRQLTDVAEFLHQEVEDVANRGAYHVLNIVVGNQGKGKAYLEGHCMSCHTAETFAHIASRFRSPEQLQRNWIWSAHAASITANVTTLGHTISGRVTQISDFRVTLVEPSGETHTLDRGPRVAVQLKDPLAAHEEMVTTLTNEDMHNVTAYLRTLK